MPVDYLDALNEADAAVTALKDITTDVVSKYFDIDGATFSALAEDTEHTPESNLVTIPSVFIKNQ